MRALKIAAAAIAAVVVVAALLLITGIPSGFMTSAIQARVEKETGYRLAINGATRIGLWPSLNVTLNDITLRDAKNRDNSASLTAGSVQANITLSSVWSGKPQITELAIDRPVISVPLQRERSREPAASPKPTTSSAGAEANALAIDRITVTNGTVKFTHLRDRVDNRIDGINVDVRAGSDRKVKLTGSARAGEHPLKFEIRAVAPRPPLDRQNIPTEFTLEASGLLQAPLSGRAEVRLNGSVVMINGLTGSLGDGAFNGWASVDLASKPVVKLDLDFQRLDVAIAKTATAAGSPSAPQSWSNASIDLTGLNYIDGQMRISAAELNIGDAQFAPAAIDGVIESGVARVRFSNLGAYGGVATGQIDVDASTGNPTYAMRCDLTGVRAMPLLRSVADFDKLDGKLQAKIGVKSAGASQRAIMSNLGGAVFVVFQDGAIRGLNVAAMIRSLTSNTLSGWQEGKEQATDLTQLSGSFRIDKGQATSSDLNLVGPLVRMTGTGTIDLVAKSLAFRVEPKLVMTTEGQGRANDPVGLGIPVMIDGPWAEPRIYPDMAGILDNPDAAYAKLKEMGKGLFGANGGGLGAALGGLSTALGGNGPAGGSGAAGSTGISTGDPLGGRLGETLGNLLSQGLGQGLNQQGLNQQGSNQQGSNQGRNIPAIPAPSAAAPAAPPPPQSDSAAQPQDNPAMNDVLKQLFNR